MTCRSTICSYVRGVKSGDVSIGLQGGGLGDHAANGGYRFLSQAYRLILFILVKDLLDNLYFNLMISL